MYTKWPYVEYIKWPQNIPYDLKYTNNHITMNFQIYPNLDFGYENIPSGNPDFRLRQFGRVATGAISAFMSRTLLVSKPSVQFSYLTTRLKQRKNLICLSLHSWGRCYNHNFLRFSAIFCEKLQVFS
jgi:hypothetical protein